MKNIILIGMPGSGKSSVGVIVAKTLGMNFIDVDLLIQNRENALLQELLDSVGMDGFLELEADAVCSIQAENAVIAPGGSAVLCERGAKHLKELGTVVYLKTDIADLESHLHNLSSRGVARKPGQTIADVYRYRAPFYEKYADITVNTAGQSLAKTVGKVLDALKGAT
ncbi:MAG: shikimate kinase [Eubacteriales bacterium]